MGKIFPIGEMATQPSRVKVGLRASQMGNWFRLDDGAFWRSAQPPVLVQDKIVGHARDVIANDAVERLVLPVLLVTGRQVAWRANERLKQLGDHLLRLLLVRAQFGAVIEIPV